MSVRWVLATLHLWALGIGLGAIWARGRALRHELDTAGVRRVLYADTWWGIAALIWISTGLIRLFGGYEKATGYYLANHLFWAKMGFLVVILGLEIAPMIGLIRWRTQLAHGRSVDRHLASRFATISFVQVVLIAAMVLAAAGMARGYGSSG